MHLHQRSWCYLLGAAHPIVLHTLTESSALQTARMAESTSCAEVMCALLRSKNRRLIQEPGIIEKGAARAIKWKYIDGLMPNRLGTLRGGVMKGNLLGVAEWEDKTGRMAGPAEMN